MSEPSWPLPRGSTSDYGAEIELLIYEASISRCVHDDQFSQEQEHAEKLNDFPHAIPAGQITTGPSLRHASPPCRGEGGACTAITCHGQMKDHRHARTMCCICNHTERLTCHITQTRTHGSVEKPHLCREASNTRGRQGHRASVVVRDSPALQALRLPIPSLYVGSRYRFNNSRNIAE